MDITGLHLATALDIGAIADLTTQVATTGALRVAELVSDEVFEFTIGIVVVEGCVRDLSGPAGPAAIEIPPASIIRCTTSATGWAIGDAANRARARV